MMRKDYKEALKNPIFSIISEASKELQLESFVIGGYVRDFILGKKPPKDIEIVTVGSGIKLAKKVASMLKGKPNVTVFKNFGTAMLRYKESELEFVGARKESYTRDSRKPIVEDGSLEDDQRRRDFTINTLAFSLGSSDFAQLSDPFDGLMDLKNGIIKTPLDPSVTYSDDPLRMMRAIRFATQLKFEIELSSLKAITENKDRIKIVSKERIVDELHKMIESDRPSIAFALLHRTELLPYILPELSALEGIEEIEGQKHKDNFWHTLEVLDNIATKTDNLWLRWAALLHDIGKAPTKRFDKKIGWTFHAHEFVGSKMVYKLFKRLRLPLNDKMKFVQKMVLLSSRPIILSKDFITDSAVRRLVFDTGEHIDDLMTLCEADITTKNPARQRKYLNNFKLVRRKIVEVEERDRIRNFQPPISGELIMETFNIGPSKEIGLIKDAIKEAILDGIIPNEYEAAHKYMLEQGEKLGLVPTKN